MEISVCIGDGVFPRDAALSAAHWIGGFYAHVSVSVQANAITLASTNHDEASLAAIWTTAFANEQLFDRGREDRAQVFDALAR